ncbi:MAG TPA: NPCBM/NEW2 domain-containing protein [Sumerlaeia bacterium]|nr:NPCBM/NEW2 domain-containing protein [Sumerlaeia bacterium]
MMELDLQRRDPETGAPSIAKETIDPRRTLVLVIDAWEYHWCSTWTGLAGGRIPRMNRALQGARELGMTVVHAPTDAASSMAGTPQRERMAALPRLPLPEPLEISIPPFPNGEGSEGCMCHGGFGCIVNYGERAIHPGMVIAEGDLVSADAEEVFTWCKTKGITHIIYTGFATNMCLFGKPEGVRTMVKAGMRCILARDLTEAFYANQGAASADRLTNAAVEHIEKRLAPTIDFEAELRKAGKWSDDCVVDPVRIVPWGFQDRPQVFKDSLEISMSFPFNPKAEIRYTLDGAEPGPASSRYAAPFEIRDSTTLRAAAFQKGRRVSLPSECRYVRQAPLPPTPDVFISDLEPAQITMAGGWNWLAAPGGSPNPPPQRDRSYAQTPLQLRGEKFDKGMGVYAPCQLVYSVKPEYEAFVAQAGADESMLSHNLGCQRASFPSVAFRVFIDGELQAESPIMRISQPPWRFRVEIPDGAKVISLAVTDAGDGNREDLANWVNAGFLLRK